MPRSTGGCAALRGGLSPSPLADPRRMAALRGDRCPSERGEQARSAHVQRRWGGQPEPGEGDPPGRSDSQGLRGAGAPKMLELRSQPLEGREDVNASWSPRRLE